MGNGALRNYWCFVKCTCRLQPAWQIPTACPCVVAVCSVDKRVQAGCTCILGFFFFFFGIGTQAFRGPELSYKSFQGSWCVCCFVYPCWPDTWTFCIVCSYLNLRSPKTFRMLREMHTAYTHLLSRPFSCKEDGIITSSTPYFLCIDNLNC